MSKRRRSSEHAARTWSSLLDDERIALEQRYFRAICSLAVSQVNQANIDAEQVGEEPPYPTPDYEDEEEVVNEVNNGSSPPWWPKRLGRMRIMVKIKDHVQAAETYGPHIHDPNRTDLGTKAFRGIVLMLCESVGDNFFGHIEIKIQNTTDKRTIGGWKGDVQVGDGPTKGKGGSSNSYGDEQQEAWTEYMTEQMQRKDAAMIQMFGQSSHVIHASAAALNATRGVNLAPPWMQEGEGGGSPIWMALAGEAVKIVGGALLKSGQQPTPGHMAGQLLTTNVPPHQQHPGYGQPQYHQQGQHLLTMDPAGSPPESPDISLDGDYDGVMIEDDYFLEEDDEERDSSDIVDEEEDSEEYSDEYEDEDEDENEDEDEDDHRKKSSNPLEGLSAEELTAHLESYIDQHNNPDEVKRLGLRLASKIMG